MARQGLHYYSLRTTIPFVDIVADISRHHYNLVCDGGITLAQASTKTAQKSKH